MAEKQLPLDQGSARQIWIGWGTALSGVGLSYPFGSPFLAYCLVFSGIVLALRGHQPKWFYRHVEAQLIAGTPGRTEHSIKAWLVAFVSILGLTLGAAFIQEKAVATAKFGAKLNVTRTQVTLNPSNPHVNIMFRNIGSSQAIGLKHTLTVSTSDKPKTKAQLDQLTASVIVTYTADTDDEIQPNDLDEGFFSYPLNAIQDSYARRVESGQLLLYVITVIQYRDPTIDKGDVIVTESCSYYADGSDVEHKCDFHNRIYLDRADHNNQVSILGRLRGAIGFDKP